MAVCVVSFYPICICESTASSIQIEQLNNWTCRSLTEMTCIRPEQSNTHNPKNTRQTHTDTFHQYQPSCNSVCEDNCMMSSCGRSYVNEGEEAKGRMRASVSPLISITVSILWGVSAVRQTERETDGQRDRGVRLETTPSALYSPGTWRQNVQNATRRCISVSACMISVYPPRVEVIVICHKADSCDSFWFISLYHHKRHVCLNHTGFIINRAATELIEERREITWAHWQQN